MLIHNMKEQAIYFLIFYWILTVEKWLPLQKGQKKFQKIRRRPVTYAKKQSNPVTLYFTKTNQHKEWVSTFEKELLLVLFTWFWVMQLAAVQVQMGFMT